MQMSMSAAVQSAAYTMRLKRRSRQFADALKVHAAGLTVVGASSFGGRTNSGAMFVKDAAGNPWVALTSGISGATPLSGSATMSDGSITWQPWLGIIRSAPPTPA
jgi:hypothetical protein